MKRQILCILLLLCVLAVCAGCHTGSPSVLAQTESTTDDSRIEIAYRVCDTGGGRIEGWTSLYGMPGETAQVSVKAVAELGYVFTGWSDGVVDAERHDVFGENDKTVIANFSFDRLELPIMSITTVTGKDVTSKDSYISAAVSICNTGSTAYEMSGVSAGIRGRGNASLSHDKHSYRIRFDQKQQPLGLGGAPDRSWVLIGNENDHSILRNALAIDLANRLDGLGFNSSCTHVELYLNGEYRGVYLMAEPIQVDAARVDIGEEDHDYDPMAVDAGFLVELDNYAEPLYDFRVGDKRYQVKSDVRTDEQFTYIKDYIAAVNAAIQDGDGERLAALVDIDSFIDGYLLEEYLKNIDVGWSSFYMHKKPGEKMVLGPFWDFDLAAGNDNRLDNGSSKELYVGKYRADFPQFSPWFVRLAKQEWFAEAVTARWKEISVYLDENLTFLDCMLKTAPQSFTRNYEKWDIDAWPVSIEYQNVMPLDTWEAHVQLLRLWLTDRRAWLDDCFSSADTFASAVQKRQGHR